MGKQSAKWQEIIVIIVTASSSPLNPEIYLNVVKWITGLNLKLIQRYTYMCNRWINSCLIQTRKQNPLCFLDDHQKKTTVTVRLDDLFVETTTDAQSLPLQLPLSCSRETLTGSCWQHSSLLQWFQRSSMGKAFYERLGLCRDLQRYSLCWCHPAGTREGINQCLDTLKACRGLAICKWVWKRLRQPSWAEQRQGEVLPELLSLLLTEGTWLLVVRQVENLCVRWESGLLLLDIVQESCVSLCMRSRSSSSRFC